MKTSLSTLVVAGMVIGFVMADMARAEDTEGPMATLRFVVLRGTDGKPVRNAEVVLHPVKHKGKQANGEMELKTDAEGKATIDGIPFGALRVQVLAPHFQTFGEDYEINKAEMDIVVKLRHPGEQYSAYDKHTDDKRSDDNKPQ